MPALTSLFGESAWWPGRRLRGMSAEEIVERVAARAGLSWDEAHLLTEGTLDALARADHAARAARARPSPAVRVPPRDRALARRPERFSADEFLARARARAGGKDVGEDEMRAYAGAVLTTLQEAAPDDLAYVRAQLSDDYDPLFRTSDAGRRRAGPRNGQGCAKVSR